MCARYHLRIAFADGGDRSDRGGGVHPTVACGELSLINPLAHGLQVAVSGILGGSGRKGYLIRASSV